MLSFTAARDELFFMSESIFCYLAEQLIFEPEWELFVLVLRYVSWIMRVNYPSVRGLHSIEGRRGHLWITQAWDFCIGHLVNWNTMSLGTGGWYCISSDLLRRGQSAIRINQSHRKDVCLLGDLDIDVMDAAQLQWKTVWGQGIRLLWVSKLSTQRKSL